MIFLFLAMIEGEGDKGKFILLFESYRYRMLYIANSILHDRTLSEDAVQESFLYLAKNIRKVPEDIHSKETMNYIFIVTKHISIDIVRKNQRHRNVNISELTEKDFAIFPNPEDIYISNTGVKRILYEIRNMPVAYRECLELNILHGYPPREISKLMHRDVAWVRQKLYWGKKRLRVILSGSNAYE